MPNFFCEYMTIGEVSERLKIEAESHQGAYEIFYQKTAKKNLPVSVSKGILGSVQHFSDHVTKQSKEDSDEKLRVERERKLKKQKEELKYRENSALNGCNFLNEKGGEGYFKLSKHEKIYHQNLFKSIINYSLNEVLLDEEIEFLHLWNNFKDRHFGQTLIAQNEAQKPPAERGQSELANTIVSGIAVGNLIKANQLNEMREMNDTMDEMAEDVEDVNEGFGFDE